MSPNTRRRVLVVDDDDDLAEVLSAVLESFGYVVGVARNGREALEYLRSHDGLDVVLLDLMMPVMNGWEFRVEQLKDPRLSSIPVIVFSGQGKLEHNALSIGAAAYLHKPVGVPDLLGALGRVLEPREAGP
jgi:CheY-like chemotaxis protein